MLQARRRRPGRRRWRLRELRGFGGPAAKSAALLSVSVPAAPRRSAVVLRRAGARPLPSKSFGGAVADEVAHAGGGVAVGAAGQRGGGGDQRDLAAGWRTSRSRRSRPGSAAGWCRRCRRPPAPGSARRPGCVPGQRRHLPGGAGRRDAYCTDQPVTSTGGGAGVVAARRSRWSAWRRSCRRRRTPRQMTTSGRRRRWPSSPAAGRPNGEGGDGSDERRSCRVKRPPWVQADRRHVPRDVPPD